MSEEIFINQRKYLCGRKKNIYKICIMGAYNNVNRNVNASNEWCTKTIIFFKNSHYHKQEHIHNLPNSTQSRTAKKDIYKLKYKLNYF